MRPRTSRRLDTRRNSRGNRSVAAVTNVFSRRLLIWFKSNARDLPWRRKASAYNVLVAEKLLQQTDVGHVLRVYREFFRRFPSLAALSSAKVMEIENAIRPLGFWRQRALQLKRMATLLVRKYDTEIPASREALMELPGIGRYIANSFLSVNFEQNEIAIDVNVRKVSQRLFYWPRMIPSDEELESLFKKVVPANETKALNWAILDFAALICRRQPRCSECFATDICRYYRLVAPKSN